MQKITISNKTELAKSAIDNNAAMIFTIAALNKGLKKDRLSSINFDYIFEQSYLRHHFV